MLHTAPAHRWLKERTAAPGARRSKPCDSWVLLALSFVREMDSPVAGLVGTKRKEDPLTSGKSQDSLGRPDHGRVEPQAVEVRQIHPGRAVNFPVISLESKIAVGFEQEPHVVVEMRRNAAARRDRMDIEIEGARRDEIERREPRFFEDLAARHGPEVRLAVDHEGGGGEVAREVGAIETIRIVEDERGDLPQLFAVALVEQERGLQNV